MTRRSRAFLKLVARIVAAIVTIGIGYALVGMLAGMIPRNAGWRPPAQGGVTIWIEDNGVHTGFVLPKQAVGIDWRSDFPARDLSDPNYATFDHVAIGWGERGFFLGTPTWWDVRPTTVLRAAFGSRETLLHVEHVPSPHIGPHTRAIVLRPDEYRRLAAAIRASRTRGDAVHGYAGYDAFYPGRGRYDAITTCNAWTSNTLAIAGVRVGWWTPFAGTVMRWF